jgi:iron complex outermembrane receptor protein
MKPSNPRALASLCAFVMICGGVFVSPTFAETTDDEEPTESGLVEEVLVEGEEPRTQTEILDEGTLEMGRYANLAVALEMVPGVSGVRRSLNAYEPVIRGLGWERVQTQVNGLPIYGACPGRMDPPATVVAQSSVQETAVVKGLSSLTLGPAGTGGRLMLSTDYDRGADAGREVSPWGRAAYNGAGDAYNLEAGVEGGTARFDYSAGLDAFSQGDYESGDGTVVPANQDERGATLSLGGRPTDTQRVFGSVVVQDGEEIDYPSLPMDTDSTETRLYNVGYRLLPSDSSLAKLDLRVGYGNTDHVMSNRNRPNRSMVEAEAVSYSESASAGANSDWRLTESSSLEAGLDYSALDRDAVRERHMVTSGMTFYDHIWPEVSQDDTGAFAEYQLTRQLRWNLRLGARFDAVASKAKAADDPSLGGQTARYWYEFFYGPEAAKTDRDESLPSANVVVHRTFAGGVTLEAGIGLVSRAASVTERYYAFAPAPGGFLVGNPALDAERKRELVVGTTVARSRWNGALSVYYYSVADYINPTNLAETDVNMDGQDDLVRGFVNVDATLYGGELSGAWQATRRIDVPFSLAYVHGDNDTTGNPLPLIPAPEAYAAVRFELSERRAGWVELGGRFVAKQDRVDPDYGGSPTTGYGEDPTPGYAVWHLRGGVTLAKHFVLEAGIENLFDKEYWEHLTPTAVMPVGDLQAGQEIPQPGRALFIAARIAY